MLNILFQEGKKYVTVYHFGTQNSVGFFLTFIAEIFKHTQE